MPATRRTKQITLAPSHAAHALSILIEDGKLKAQDVARALARREAMIRELRERLAALGEGFAEKVRPATRGRKPRRRRRITKAQRSARQTQGQYLGAVRRLPKAARAKIRAIREKAGVRAAIAEARRMATRATAPDRRPKRKPALRKPRTSRP